MKLPASLQSILWSADIKQLDLTKDKIYIINQILSYGGLKELRWLFSNYDTRLFFITLLGKYMLRLLPILLKYFPLLFLTELEANKARDSDVFTQFAYYLFN